MRTRCNKKLVNVNSAGAVSGPVGPEDEGVEGAEGFEEGEEGCTAYLEICVCQKDISGEMGVRGWIRSLWLASARRNDR